MLKSDFVIIIVIITIIVIVIDLDSLSCNLCIVYLGMSCPWLNQFKTILADEVDSMKIVYY